ncbi:MAG TPA: enoyl-CoA hydratase/isomerase family protein [Candidatus Margulisiibacteriota bacterium]|nr:enoyl-CoA hydratase/isomerase family protein [Candidatus Margulisiibacteriota bacterium]
MPDFKAILYNLENDVAWVTMNRPEQRNAVNAELRDELVSVFTDARTNAGVRAVVLTGAGKGFCTGADLSGPRGQGPTGPGAGRELMKGSSQRLIRALWDLEKPVVAAVNGVAAGLGSHLAFGSDFVIASSEARFIEVFVRRGIAVDAGGAFLLPRLVGLQKAKQMVFFGDDMSAEDAERWGLVSKVVAPDQLEATAREWADRLAKGPTFAIGMSKRLLNRSLESSLETALEEEAMAQMLVTQSEDTREGMLAFMERRQPQFKGR